MTASTKEPQSLVQIGLVSILVVAAGELDGTTEKLANEPRRGFNARVLVGNVVLQAGALINGEFDTLIDWTTKTLVILAGIQVIGVVLGVIDVLFGASLWVSVCRKAGKGLNVPVAAKTLLGDFKLAGAVTEGHETEDPEQEPDGLCADHLESTNLENEHVSGVSCYLCERDLRQQPGSSRGANCQSRHA